MEPLNNDKQEKIADLELKNFEKTSVKTFTSKQSRHKNDIGNDRVYMFGLLMSNGIRLSRIQNY